MKAIDTLMQEHRLIERVLDALEIAADHVTQRDPVRPGFFLDAADFIAGFADGCHHHKEEDVLFDAMGGSGAPDAGGTVDMMLEEHEQGRVFTRAMREAARRLERGDDTGRSPLLTNARRYVALLRDHIMKEDEMLFPMADELLSEPEQAELNLGIERIEREEAAAGTPEKFRALAEKLEEEAKALRTEGPLS
jgi:hemerythrin-like domain-containing protein